MKTAVRGAIAVLMLLGLAAGAIPNNTDVHPAAVMVAGGGPMPLCNPSDPTCRPPIPPAKRMNDDVPALVAGGGPMPMCNPSDPTCRPPIPPAKGINNDVPVLVAGGGPMPMCDPSDPNCRPPIPPAR